MDFNRDEDKDHDFRTNDKMLFAHRGLAEFAENSWQGFKQSQTLGFNSIECDVQFTKDNKLIIFHDKNAKRLLGIDQKIEDLMWSQIQAKAIIHNNEISDQYVLSLDELLRLSSDFQHLYLDFKTTNKTIADSLLVLMKKHQAYERVLLADANILFLAYLKHKVPQIKTVLEGFNKGKEWTYYLIPTSLKPDYFASFLSEVDDKHIQFLNEQNLLPRKVVYGINKSNYQQAIDKGLIHLIIDYDSSLSSQITAY
ncbi:glycerophosphodiester phosphodiesterase family protein [Flavobacteriales bacterium]|nr:glycerophosphodiester phosphodiesterase family protein [Flavobacteriales bacterium]